MNIAAGGSLRPRGENSYAQDATYDLVARPDRLSKSPGSVPSASAIWPSTVTLADTSPRSIAPT